MSNLEGKQEGSTKATEVKPTIKQKISEDEQTEPGPSKEKRPKRYDENRSHCSMCHNNLNDAVSFDCGHWYCQDCITLLREQSGDLSCPSPICGLKETFAEHKHGLKTKCESVAEGIETGNRNSLNRVYTELYITEGHSEGVSTQHEVRQLEEDFNKKKIIQETQIRCHDIFKPLQSDHQPIRVVLTSGVAGVGKTFSVLKFILDWAQGSENQEVDLLVPLSFRELNLVRGGRYSLLELINVFHPSLQKLTADTLVHIKVLFIFDGLDESRLTLDFNCEVISEVTQTSEVKVLLVNLIKGSLLPSALIWITSRPAAANQIPPEYVHRVTEVRGFFTDDQKEQYFRKRFTDEDQCDRVLSHIRTSKTLYSMCEIPVFCWITATVLDHILETEQEGPLPQTLTNMYAHFLKVHTQRKRKYSEEISSHDLTEADCEVLLKLGRLAFEQLQEGNIMFYQEDLQLVGLNLTEASVHSGLCTEIFKQESVIFQQSVYCFVHLSVQEFLAAVYMHHCFNNKKIEVLEQFLKYWEEMGNPEEEDQEVEEMEMKELEVEEKEEEQEVGHGKENVKTLEEIKEKEEQVKEEAREMELVKKTEGQEVVQVKQEEELEVVCDKEKIKDNVVKEEENENVMEEKEKEQSKMSTQEIWNWFDDGDDTDYDDDIDNNDDVDDDNSDSNNEDNDDSDVDSEDDEDDDHDNDDVDDYDEDDDHDNDDVDDYDEDDDHDNDDDDDDEDHSNDTDVDSLEYDDSFDLNLHDHDDVDGDDSDTDKDDDHDDVHSFALDVFLNKVMEISLNVENGHLDLFVRFLHGLTLESNGRVLEGILGPNKIKQVTIQKVISNLKEMNTSQVSPDRSINIFHCLTEMNDRSVHQQIQEFLKSESSEKKNLSEIQCSALAYMLQISEEVLDELDLKKYNTSQEGRWRLIPAVRNCRKALFSECELTETHCGAVVSALMSNSSDLRELDLSKNYYLRDIGVQLLSDGLRSSHCKLEILKIKDCMLTWYSCSLLASALTLHPSNLKELDLSDNFLQDSGVEHLINLIQYPLLKLRLQCCSFSAVSCSSLASALKSNSSHLRELDVSYNELQDSGVESLCDFLQSPLCELQTLGLRYCRLSVLICSSLASALKSNPSHLRVLDLSDNYLQDSGVELLCGFLQSPHCGLHTLRLIRCSLTMFSCATLALALKTNPSHLRELNLSKNLGLKDPGVVLLCDYLQNPLCKLDSLRLKFCGLSDISCSSLVSALKCHPSSTLTELDLRQNDITYSGLDVLSKFQTRPGCLLHTLRIDGIAHQQGPDCYRSSGDEKKQFKFRPEMLTESGNVSYRFRCPGSGAFCCSSTGLVFVMEKGVELQYRIVQWDEALLQTAGRTPAGPLYNIECPERAVSELHFPHCEPEHADLSKSQLSVAHITDSGISFIEPLRITKTHVVVTVFGLSIFVLVWKFFEKNKPVSGQVLLFRTPRCSTTETIKLNMFLLPQNIPVEQVESKQRTTTQYIDAPSKCKLIIDQHYSVVCPSADKIQPEKTQFDMDHEPNYHPSFEIRLPVENTKMTITVKETGRAEYTEVWKHELDLTDAALSKDKTTKTESDSVAKLSSLRSQFAENVTDSVLNQLLDRLLEKKIINSQEMESTKVKPRADKARSVLDAVIKKGAKASLFLIEVFCELDPMSDLSSKLT